MAITMTCPHCERVGRVADGSALPPMVRCPGCGQKFPSPKIDADEASMISEALSVPKVTTKECDFCGETILIAAKKCRHCGEILDVAMRATSSGPPTIINNVSATATAVAIADGQRGRSIFAKMVGLGFLLVMIGLVVNASNPRLAVWFTGPGALLIIVGVPLLLLSRIWGFFAG